MKEKIALILLVLITFIQLNAQKLVPITITDSGQTGSFTSTPGEDSDFVINPQSLTDNSDGTITDNNTGLMWQKTDGGEMTFENAVTYCQNLKLSGYSDWRLPTDIELFSINDYNFKNPTLNTTYFTKTTAEYWWTSELQTGDASKVWAVNAGGGIGAHPKTETVSSGGDRKFHVRAVRTLLTTSFPAVQFTDNGNGTITDNYTGLIWQQIQSPTTMTWEEALVYAKNKTLGDKTDWRLPNIKEIQSLNNVKLSKPSFNKNFFTSISSGNFWTSTTLQNTLEKAWDINVEYGIVSYNLKTVKENVLLVRGGIDNTNLNISEAEIPGGEFKMGDHFGFVDPAHPSDELPIHNVKVNSFYIATTETSHQQYLAFLNSSLLKGEIEVKNNIVYLKGTSDIVCYTHQYAPYYSIGFDGTLFSIADFRINHPMVGVMWGGAAAYCNWLSLMNGLDICYNLKTSTCDFTKKGYRLPTEAEWEYAARGGNLNPYLNYPIGNTLDTKAANLPNSGDPYESTNINLYPFTTPVGFYNGKLHSKSEFNWPGSPETYQTNNGANGFGLFDMQGNVWEFVNDWYGQNYYSISPFDNPKGPDTGFLMPDGKAYRGMRGGNWYNGLQINGVSDGHSRVSNRNPSYYRGPQDPNHPYYHLGFRVARNNQGSSTGTGIIKTNTSSDNSFINCYPNPFSENTTLRITLLKPEHVRLRILNLSGLCVTTIFDSPLKPGTHIFNLNAEHLPEGIYFGSLQTSNELSVIKMVIKK